MTVPRIWPEIVLILGSGVYLYFNLFTLMGVPYLLGGDQIFFWVYAQRLLNGESVYRDFFQFTPPGTDLVFLGLFKLFGPRIWITNCVVLVLGVILCWLCFRISRMLMKESQALLAASLFLVLIYGKLLNATHHWFSVFAVMMALAVLMKATTSARIMAAGALLGLASFFTQTRGVAAAAGVAVFLVWMWSGTKLPSRNCIGHLALLLLLFAVTWTALSGYFIATTGLRQLLEFQINSARYAIGGRTFLSLGLPQEDLTWRRIPAASQYIFIYLLLPCVYAVCVWKCWHGRLSSSFPDRERVALLTLTGLAMMLEVAQSPNWLRVYCVAMPAIILFFWLLKKPGRIQIFATGFMWIGIFVLMLSQTAARSHEQTVLVHVPAGTIATRTAMAEKLNWLAQRTQPGQFLFQVAWPGVYLPLGLRNPVFVDELDTRGITLPAYVDSSIRQLDAKSVQYILWSPQLNSPSAGENPADYHLTALREYLEEHYRRIQSFPDRDELWERKQPPQ